MEVKLQGIIEFPVRGVHSERFNSSGGWEKAGKNVNGKHKNQLS